MCYNPFSTHRVIETIEHIEQRKLCFPSIPIFLSVSIFLQPIGHNLQ